MNLKKVVRLALFLALAIVLNIAESFIPFFNGVVPGLKIGLTNVIILFVLYFYSIGEAIVVSLLRVVIVGLLRTGLFSIPFIFSLAGAITALIFMYLAKRFFKFSIIGVSVIGSVTHSIAQLVAAMFIFKTANFSFYVPVILLISVPTGIIVGVLARKVLSLMNKKDGIEEEPVVEEETVEDENQLDFDERLTLKDAVENVSVGFDPFKNRELSIEKEEATKELFEESDVTIDETDSSDVQEEVVEEELVDTEPTKVEEESADMETIKEEIVEEEKPKKNNTTKKNSSSKKSSSKKKSNKKK